MAGTLPPGIGNDQQALQATAFMRQQPWYQQWLAQQGIRPENPNDPMSNPHLTDAQQEQLLALARQNGIGISDSYQIDQNGQIAQQPSHLLRNILIGAGIGGGALTGLGALGIGPLTGLFGGAAADASAGGVMSGLPGAMSSLPAAVGDASAGGVMAGLPGAMNALPAASGAGSGASALAGATSALTGTSGLSNALKAITTLGAALGGHAIASASGSNNVPPQLSQLLDMAVQRQQQQQPMAQAVDQGMYSMLPNFAKTGTSMPNVPASPAQGLTALLGAKTNG